MRVWNSRGHEELEVVIVGDLFVSKTEGARFVDLAEKNRFKSGIQLFADVFNKDPLSMLNGDFKHSQKCGVTHFDDFKANNALLLVTREHLDELVSLVLRVDHEWPS